MTMPLMNLPDAHGGIPGRGHVRYPAPLDGRNTLSQRPTVSQKRPSLRQQVIPRRPARPRRADRTAVDLLAAQSCRAAPSETGHASTCCDGRWERTSGGAGLRTTMPPTEESGRNGRTPLCLPLHVLRTSSLIPRFFCSIVTRSGVDSPTMPRRRAECPVTLRVG